MFSTLQQASASDATPAIVTELAPRAASGARAPPHKNPYLVKLTHIDMACTTVVAASSANAW